MTDDKKLKLNTHVTLTEPIKQKEVIYKIGLKGSIIGINLAASDIQYKVLIPTVGKALWATAKQLAIAN